MKRKKVQVKMRNIFERDKYKTPITKNYTKAKPPPPDPYWNFKEDSQSPANTIKVTGPLLVRLLANHGIFYPQQRVVFQNLKCSY